MIRIGLLQGPTFYKGGLLKGGGCTLYWAQGLAFSIELVGFMLKAMGFTVSGFVLIRIGLFN